MAHEVPRRDARKALTRIKNELESGGDVSHLNITAMMDMMSILLVFMLKQFATEQAALTLNADIQPPKSTSQLKPPPSLNVTVSTTAIIVEGDPVVAVRGGHVDPNAKPDGPNGFLIRPLTDTLTKHATRLKKLEVLTQGAQKFEGTMLLLVDRSIPYRLLTEVLYSAGQAEFRNYRLVVLQKQ